MIRVLHIVPALDGGGIENLLLNYYSKMNRENFIFDFVVHGREIGSLEPVFAEMNSRIFHIPSKHESFLQNLRSMKEIIKNGNYDVVHAHQGAIGAFPMYFAKKASINTRITHSHVAFMEENILQKLINGFLLIFLKKYSTNWFACGRDAGRFLWGNKAVSKGKVHVINNAIDTEKFIFNNLLRESMRYQLGIEGKFVVGNVGRLSYQKNHELIIKIFSEIYNLRKDAVLLLVGSGELEGIVKKQVAELGLCEVVKFLGIRNDVPSLLQAMDVFLLPSKYEGLPVVLVETQANGLRNFVSSNVTKEIALTELVDFISNEENPSVWAEMIVQAGSNISRRFEFRDIIAELGYDIKNEAVKLESLYASLVGSNK